MEIVINPTRFAQKPRGWMMWFINVVHTANKCAFAFTVIPLYAAGRLAHCVLVRPFFRTINVLQSALFSLNPFLFPLQILVTIWNSGELVVCLACGVKEIIATPIWMVRYQYHSLVDFWGAVTSFSH